jgi:hypothetical protein
VTKKILLSIFLAAFIANLVHASGVAGQISDTGGEALPFAAIFVKETGSGTVANEDGYYEIRLQPGSYTLVFQFLGFESATRMVKVQNGPFSLIDVQLKAQVIQLRTVEITSKQEDPAYTVMRKAIAKAGFHRQQIESYSAQVYVKGSGRLKSAPFFLRGELKKEGIDSTYAFVSESVSKIEYQRPATFKETVISIRKQGNDNNSSPAPFLNGSFYEPEIAEIISPLSPKAFAYYKFRHAGYFIDRGYGVNKIQVIPRSKGENVCEGFLYILEDYWSIYSLSLQSYKLGVTVQIDQTYAPIYREVWLPIKYQIGGSGSFFGVAFEYNYIATVSDYKIELNPSLEAPLTIVDEKKEPEAAKNIKATNSNAFKNANAEQKLAAGKELTAKELRQIVKDYEREDRKSRESQAPDSLIGLMAISDYNIDSSAYQRDSVYWAVVRPVPLTSYEIKGYKIVDSIAVVQASEAAVRDSLGIAQDTEKSEERDRKEFKTQHLLFGGSYQLNPRSNLSFSPLVSHINFNPVEGFHTWTNIRYSTSYSKKSRLIFDLSPRFAVTPKKFSAKGGIEYRAGNPGRLSTFRIEGGRYIFQFNAQKPISELLNTLSCLFYERNFIRLYEKDYLAASFRIPLSDKITLRGGVEWAQRYHPENRTTQAWFNRTDRVYASNIPTNEIWQGPPAEPENAFLVRASLTARPWLKYRMRNGERQVIRNSSPTVGLYYRKGIEGIGGSITDFDHIDMSFQHRFKVGAAGNMDIKTELGWFLNNDYTGFADFRHFMGNRLPLVTSSPVGSYRLLDYYTYSTNAHYLAAHVHYQFRKLLFTRIPKVWLMGIKENLFVNYLGAPTSGHYTELGYSVDNIFRIFRAEAVMAIQDGRYYDWGIRVGIASNLGFLRFD